MYCHYIDWCIGKCPLYRVSFIQSVLYSECPYQSFHCIYNNGILATMSSYNYRRRAMGKLLKVVFDEELETSYPPMGDRPGQIPSAHIEI